LHSLIREELAIDCFIELVPPHTLPRTSSGKLSRSGARREFLKRLGSERLSQLHTSHYRTAAGEKAV
jgi:fatty-acyl-CoA synthase